MKEVKLQLVRSIESIGNTPEEFRAQIVHDLAMWGAIIKKANIKLIDAQ